MAVSEGAYPVDDDKDELFWKLDHGRLDREGYNRMMARFDQIEAYFDTERLKEGVRECRKDAQKLYHRRHLLWLFSTLLWRVNFALRTEWAGPEEET